MASDPSPDFLQALIQLTQDLARAQSYEEVLAAAQRQLRPTLGLQQIWCYLFDERRAHIQSLAARGDIAESELAAPLTRLSVVGNPLLELVAAADTPVVIADALDDPRATMPLIATLQARTLISLPLRLSDGQRGILAIGSFGAEGPRPPGVDALAFLEGLAGAVGVAIDRIKLGLELTSLLGTLADGVLYQDAEGRITFASPAAERILGLTAAELRGRTFAEVCWRATDEDGAVVGRADLPPAVAVRTGQPALNTILAIQTGPAHEPRWVTLNTTPHQRAGEHSPYQIVTTLTDITASRRAEAGRRESEERLRSFVEQASVGVAITDEAGRLIEWNPALEELSGIPRADVVGQPYWDAQLQMVPPDMDLGLLGERLRVAMEDAISTGQSYFLGRTVEGRLVTRGGELRTVLQTSFPIKGDHGYRIGTIVRDITAQKRDEAARRESEEKYRGLLESLESLIVTIDGDGVYRYLSPLAAAELGGSPEEFVGRRLDELYPPDIAESQLRFIRQVLATGSGVVVEQRSVVAGRPRWYRASIQPLRDAAGVARVTLVNLTDITEHKETEVVLEEKVGARTAEIESIRRRLELATWTAGIGIWELHFPTAQFSYDEQMLDLYGFTERPGDGNEPWLRRIHPDDQAPMRERLIAAARGERELDAEFRLILPDGAVRHLQTKAITLPDADGEGARLIGVNYDITIRKNAELVLRQREETLRQANAELARANRAKDEFLANMSHELRTPLNGILALSEALGEQIYGPLNPRQLHALQGVEQSGRHLLSLINDILDVSKIEAGRLELDADWFALADLCRSSLALVREQALKKGVTLAFEPPSSELTLLADPRRLKQILINLLSNAVKFTPAGGRVSLEVAPDAARRVVHLAVEDTGIGIAAEDMTRLFTPFVQVDSSLTRSHEGTGLGLALVSRLTRLHGGEVSVRSQPGQGSRFVVSLPWRAPAGEGAPARQASPADLAPPLDGAEGEPSEGLVLIVDDSKLNVDSLGDYLRHHGYEVIAAYDGQAGIALAEARRPDLILMDIQMPVLDGLEVIRRLRARPAFADTPIIALTALAMQGDRERCLAAGATDYLSKPVSLKGLLDMVRARLGWRSGEDGRG